MKMLFINPEAGVNRDIPNIGLAYAATHYEVDVIDLNTMPSPSDRFLAQEVDVLGISVQSRTYSESTRISELYREKYPRAKVVSVSGFLDIQCCYPYLELDESIRYNEPFSDLYPFPRYELFDSFRIFRKNWGSGRWRYAIMSSLGCPFLCTYCMSRNRKWLARSPENCVEELKYAHQRWGIKAFSILDDCFNVDKERVIKFCELVKPLGLSWVCANGLRADRFDELMAVKMKESGCFSLSFGVESTNPEVLKKIKKGESIGQIEEAVKIARKHFRKVNGFFIIGLPGSSYESDLNSLHWADELGINAHFSYYVPMDKGIRNDALFYGEQAKPVAETYLKADQKKIYQLTKRMRPFQGWFPSRLLSKLIN